MWRSDNSNKSALGTTLPLLPLLDGAVLLPGGFARVNAASESSISRLIEHVLLRTPSRALADVAAVPVVSPSAATTAEDDDSQVFDLDHVHSIGTAARVVELIRSPSNNSWVIVLEGRCRVKVREVTLSSQQGVYEAKVKQLDYFDGGPHARDSPGTASKEELELQRQILQGIRTMFSAAQGQRGELGARTLQILKNYGPALTSDLVGSLLAQQPRQRLALLSTTEVLKRLKMVDALLQQRLAAAGLASRTPPPSSPKKQSSPSSVQAQDSDSDDEDDLSLAQHAQQRGSEAKALLNKLRAANPPSEVLEAALKEYTRLKRTNEQHPGYAASLAYLETLADLPWSTRSSGSSGSSSGTTTFVPSLTAVRAQLDADHFGLDKVKDRIVQFVAVQSLKGADARAPVLCLVGPPGVGKTSVARSMAAALQRPFQRISLGGVRDEAEIRGHRRTYIGALPGRVITALRRARACDAVLLLDEVDKTGKDARGDPAAALLEVLDPEQNSAFVDTYLGIPVDLSKIVFVATANAAADIPLPLLDRMEVVNLGGYTVDEKIGIAMRHLVPKTLAEHGITVDQLSFSESALRELVEGYTREAGVRQLSQTLAAMCRHVAVRLVAEREQQMPSVASMGVEEGQGQGEEEESELRAVVVDHTSSAHKTPSSATQQRWFSSWLNRQNNNSNSNQNTTSSSSAWEHHQQQQESLLPSLDGPGTSPSALRLLGPGSMGLLHPHLSSSAVSSAAAVSSSSPLSTNHRQSLLLRSMSPSSPAAANPHSITVQDSINLPLIVDTAMIEQVLGPRRYRGHDAAQRISSPGAAAGLVWTQAGGAVQYIECLMVGAAHNGSLGTLTLTGQLGDVLEESARIAVSWVRAHAGALGLVEGEECPARRWDVHIHLPAGGVPKDGPSAGVTLAVALVSLFTGRCARNDTALTGELTLRGLVLPVGGVKEKVLAAVAAGMRRVILPSRNAEEMKNELTEDVRAAIELVAVERLDQVLQAAFDPPIELKNVYTHARL